MSEEELKADPLLLEFLDLDTYAQREDFLLMHAGELSDRTVDSMAMSLDIFLEDGNSLLDKPQQLLNCIRMNKKYETNRFR